MENAFFARIETQIETILNHPVPIILLRENKKIAPFLKSIKKSKNREDYDFKLNLPEGELAEEYVKNYLILYGGYKFVRYNRNTKNKKDFDLVMSLEQNGIVKEVTFEVKIDFKAGLKTNGGTGNVAIEEECRGEDSGIRTTKADYYVYLLPLQNEIGFIKVDKLKDLMVELKSKNIGRMHTDGGDLGSKTINYLMPYEYFGQNFKVREF